MLASLCIIASLSLVVNATWDGNINFKSPSLQHRSLGLNVAKIQKRTGLLARQTTNFTDSQLNFTHGVASGDPYPESVILWTRLAPSLSSDRSNVTVTGTAEFYNHETEEYIRASMHRVCTQWRIASDANFTCVVDQGTAYTTSDIDFTIKVTCSHVSAQACSDIILG
jgi:alkaline phosphatase D